jgi:signal transduction histidine kinase
MGEMISMIAHQWRQPLSAISATSSNLQFSLMVDKIDKKEFEDGVNAIMEYSAHLSTTIDDFRSFFQKNKTKELTTLNQIATSTLNIIDTSIKNKNIDIILELNCNQEFKTYSNEIKQVLLNLIKNAEDVLLDKDIKNPQIHIETSCKDNDMILIVKDNAGGVPEDIVDKIFDPYFSTKTKKDGTGLGLYMSKTIIEEHCHGKLDVSNDKNGAVFKIEITREETD